MAEPKHSPVAQTNKDRAHEARTSETRAASTSTPTGSSKTRTPASKTRKSHSGQSVIADDMAMIRAASELTRDLVTPKPLIYWSDFLSSALLGYGGLALAVLTSNPLAAAAGILLGIIALFRAGSFIHEITHLRKDAVPGFALMWNIIIGIPLLVPSFLYEGIHSLHHNRTKYGTLADPEYLPLASMKPWTVPLFVVVAALAPLALLLRFGVLTPLSLFIAPLRRLVVERYSGLVINPAFRRKAPQGKLKQDWRWQESGACLWALILITATGVGIFPLRAIVILIAIMSGIIVLNQVRTLVAHHWKNDGSVLNVTAQFLDSVNVPPPGFLPEIWAPVGLRYHAAHHLLPGLPYHALPESHRRLSQKLPAHSQYHRASHRGLFVLIGRLIAGAAKIS